MNKEEKRKYIFAQLRSLPNATQYVEVTKYIDDLIKHLFELQQENKKQKEVIDKAIEKINDYKIYCEENKGFTEYTDIEIEAIEPVISKLEDILKEVSE